MSNAEHTKSLAKNTILLYIRLLLVMGINLFSVRLILKGLGVEDYGIYNVVAGVVTMLSFVSSVLATATQRFYSYSLGENDIHRLHEVYSASLKINIIFSIVVLLLSETIGLWFINTRLVIPIERLTAANIIYQFSIISFVVSLLQVPYSAAVIAHEHMGFFALTSVVESIARFSVAYLICFLEVDRLSSYGLGLLVITICIFFGYYLYAKIKFKECRYVKISDNDLYKEIFNFSGWTMFGSIANIGMFQVNTILVNLFFGPLVNASRAISISVYSAMSLFSNSFITALRPAMIKSYAECDHGYVLKLFSLCTNVIYYLMLLVGIPLIFEMESVLRLWLDVNDPDAVLFSRLIVIYCIFLALHNPFTIIMQAMGKTKEYFVPVEIFTLLSVPATYVLYKFGLPAEYTYYAMILSVLLSHIMRVVCIKRYYSHFSLRSYIRNFCIPAFFVTLIGLIVVAYMSHFFSENDIIHICYVTLVSSICILILSFFIGVNKSDRKYLINLIKSYIS